MTKQNTVETAKAGIEATVDKASHLLLAIENINSTTKGNSEDRVAFADTLVETVKEADKLGQNPDMFFATLYETMGYSTKAFDNVTQKTVVIERKNGEAPNTVKTYRSKIVKAWDNNGREMKGIATFADVQRLYNPKSELEEQLANYLKEAGKACRKAHKSKNGGDSYARHAIEVLKGLISEMNKA